MRHLRIVLLLPTLTLSLAAHAQPARAPTLAARLGYPDSARLVILHADDIAMTPGVTRATIAALSSGAVTSASILAPTPFARELPAALPRGHRFDLGVHLTITSESAAMPWTPSAGARRVAGLLDGHGVLPLRPTSAPPPAELEAELEAQIAAVRALGVTPTHLDAHQGALYFNGPEVFGAWRRVARRACMPIAIPNSALQAAPYLRPALDDGHVAVNDIVVIDPQVPVAGWAGFYEAQLRAVRPGLTVLIVHLGEDTAAERDLFRAHTGWGADWRARDAAVVNSARFRSLVDAEGIRLVSWGEVARHAGPCRVGRE